MPDSNESHIISVELDGVRQRLILSFPGVALRQALATGTPWVGPVSIQLDKPLKKLVPVTAKVEVMPFKPLSRMTAIEKEMGQKGHHNNVLRATVPERQVVRSWNRSKYIRAIEAMPKDERDPRNNPVPFKDIRYVLPTVRKALRAMGVTEILRHMETYFDFCSTGEHIWEGQSHGFKSLQGFLDKLLVLHKSKERPWWDTRTTATRVVNDDNARLTIRIANSFAQTYMSEQKFPLEPGSKDHANFVKTADRMVNFINRKRRQGVELTQTDMIKHLLEFVETYFANHGDPVYSAHLSSEAVWSALPAFLSEKGII